MKTILRLLTTAIFFAPGLVWADPLAQELSLKAPAAKANVIHLAVAAMECASAEQGQKPDKLAVIDYSLPSSQPRLWVFDLKQRKLLYKEYVAHGRNSGENYASSFSNVNGSYQSSLGLFKTLNSYYGKHGLSLRLDGMEAGINNNALDRAIVIHGADYVNPGWIKKQGRIGRSLGCPAVRPAVAKSLINNLKGGQYVFAYYPDPQWLTSSSFFTCGGAKAPLASALADISGSKHSIE